MKQVGFIEGTKWHAKACQDEKKVDVADLAYKIKDEIWEWHNSGKYKNIDDLFAKIILPHLQPQQPVESEAVIDSLAASLNIIRKAFEIIGGQDTIIELCNSELKKYTEFKNRKK